MTQPELKPADSVPSVLIDQILPVFARPYARLARLDRPIGWWLLLLPCWWANALASLHLGRGPNFWHFLLFLIGAIAMRGAGSTWNDIVDRDLDRQVFRTRNRPIASGAVTRRQAGLFVGLLCLIGLAILLNFNRYSVVLGFLALVPVVIYPFMKRFTNHPQIVLGLAFAWGGLIGWTTLTGVLALPAWLTYFAAIFWTIGYDTIYAMQDIEDDSLVGIGSTALAYGSKVPLFVAANYVMACLLLAGALFQVGFHPIAWLGLAGFALHLAWQVRAIRFEDSKHALYLFRSNRTAGLILTAGLVVDALAQAF